WARGATATASATAAGITTSSSPDFTSRPSAWSMRTACSTTSPPNPTPSPSTSSSPSGRPGASRVDSRSIPAATTAGARRTLVRTCFPPLMCTRTRGPRKPEEPSSEQERPEAADLFSYEASYGLDDEITDDDIENFLREKEAEEE